MSDLKKFEHDLGRELVGAAYRERATARQHRPAFARRRLIPVFAIAAVLLLATVTVADLPGPFDSSEAVAEVFVITVLEDRIELDVVDIVTDPSEVQDQLRNELGLEAEVFAVASDPQLVGQVSLLGTSGDVAPQMEFNPSGTVDRVILPAGFEQSVVIEYGREAAPGELYVMTVTSPLCAQFFGETLEATVDEVSALATQIRYQAIDERGAVAVDPAPETIPGDYILVNIFALSDDSYIVAYAIDNPDRPERPTHPNCL